MYTVDCRPDAPNPGYAFLCGLDIDQDHLGPEEITNNGYAHRHHVFWFKRNYTEKFLAEHGVPLSHLNKRRSSENNYGAWRRLVAYADKSVNNLALPKKGKPSREEKEKRDELREQVLEWIKITPGCTDLDVNRKFPPTTWWPPNIMKQALRQAPPAEYELGTCKKKCIWLYGASDHGKTTAITRMIKELKINAFEYAIDDLEFKWHDNYRPNEHNAMFMDDVGPEHAPHVEHFKQLVNIKPYWGSVKCGAAVLVDVKIIFITSNHHPFRVWPDMAYGNRHAIENRMHIIESSGGDGGLSPNLYLAMIDLAKEILGIPDGHPPYALRDSADKVSVKDTLDVLKRLP